MNKARIIVIGLLLVGSVALFVNMLKSGDDKQNYMEVPSITYTDYTGRISAFKDEVKNAEILGVMVMTIEGGQNCLHAFAGDKGTVEDKLEFDIESKVIQRKSFRRKVIRGLLDSTVIEIGSLLTPVSDEKIIVITEDGNLMIGFDIDSFEIPEVTGTFLYGVDYYSQDLAETLWDIYN